MFTILDYSSALEYSIIRRYTNIVYYYYDSIMKYHKQVYVNNVVISDYYGTYELCENKSIVY